jgi:hypothetical protein
MLYDTISSRGGGAETDITAQNGKYALRVFQLTGVTFNYSNAYCAEDQGLSVKSKSISL